MRRQEEVREGNPGESPNCSAKKAETIFLRLKNREKTKDFGVDDIRSRYSLKSCVLSLVGVVFHWALLVAIATMNFVNGAYYFGTLLLFFQFVGGLFVTIYLHVLTSRKGDEEFKNELKKCGSFVPYLMYLPSFLPFFSAGLSVHLARKLRNTKVEEEEKELLHLLKVCEDRLVTEQLYESSFSAFPLGVTQLVILLEKHGLKGPDYLLLVGFLSVWKETSAAPMRLAKILNGHESRFVEIVAGLGNKGVTLLSFAFWITASRRHFANPDVVDRHLAMSTVFTVVVVLLVADSPGILAFTREMRRLLKRKVRDGGEFVLDLITFLVPLLGIAFWTWVIVFEKDLLFEVSFILPTCLFLLAFGISIFGVCFEKNLPWLGQFSTDILLLGYIAFESYFRGYDFHDIDFTYEPQGKKNEGVEVE